MEGISGVVNWDQVEPGHFEYARFRRVMTHDVNSAIQGACEAGATEIVVTDGHHSGYNILIEELDKRAHLNSGLGTALLSMMQGLDATVDGVFFIGYHARAGSSPAVLDHTWGGGILNVWLNDVLVGEHGLNAALAGHFHVPVILVSGDQTACAQTIDLIGDLEAVVVKKATGRYSAECLHPDQAQEAIRSGAYRAVARLAGGDSPKPFVVGEPINLVIEFSRTDQAQRAGRFQDALTEGRTVSVTVPDLLSAFKAFRSMAALAPLD